MRQSLPRPSRRVTFTMLVAATALLPACQGCTKGPARETLKAEGEPCEADADCETGLCFQLPGKPQVCGRRCTAGCDAATEVCTQLGFEKYGCVPNQSATCTPCETNSDCPYAADRCIVVNGAKVCGQDCSFDSVCPADFRCDSARDVTGNDVPAQCQPKSGTCGCVSTSYGQTIACTQSSDAGICRGVQTCGPMGYGACTARSPTAESCNGLDDDCDGQTDEDLGDTMCGVGECRRASANCANGVAQTCAPGAPATEICNDLDDDCDGMADDGIAKNTVTACGSCTNVCTVANGTPRCDVNTCEIATCNSPYRDCVGGYADGCETNISSSLQHCGGCNRPCSGANATPACNNGTCELTCLPNFYDIDGNAANGCEYACTATSTTDVPDLAFVDANCDGIDGHAARAIFVDGLAGVDTNPGTRALPKRTLGAGIAAAAAQGFAVYVSEGTYFEAVTMMTGVSLYGGYDATASWSRSMSNVTIISSPSTIGVTMNGLGSPLELQLFTVRSANASGAEANGDGRSSIGVLVTDSPAGLTVRGCTIQPGSGSSGASSGTSPDGPPGARGGDAIGTGASSVVGLGGASMCGAPGGNGGAPARGGSGGTQGDPGTTAPGGAPGTPGGAGGTYPGSNQNGGVGTTPANGFPGGPGANGGAGAAFGTFTAAGVYVPAPGTAGAAGQTGGGGGGAGGGSGMKRNSGSLGCSNIHDLWGGYGGGGGGGGCGGTGGVGGRGAGGSFGIVGLASPLTVASTTISTASGGTGGVGGGGGRGGTGGQPGGSGANPECESGGCPSGCGGVGGVGAWGGRGGNAGGGGGGGGGPSVCVVYRGTAPTTSSLNCMPGSGGGGGLGGQGDGSTAAGGATGLTATTQAAP